MTNKDKIFDTLKNLTKKCIDNGEHGVTAIQISTYLNIQRNTVSHYLNELYKECKILKINSRPVYFLDKSVYENNKIKYKSVKTNKLEEYKEPSKDSPFIKLIGYRGSLKSQVEQCKAATSYPNNGLPILLTGESGVGKSFMAQLAYEYAKSCGFISKNASFVIFNCADYSNNPELLSGNLFGYQKGTFTGANADKPGLIEEANGGYIFLDEVHRLPPEGQEKLFLLMDKGIFRRLGDTGKFRTTSLRFIFATTEIPEKAFLPTFLRRIPVIINMPNLSDRPINERLEIIYEFYKDEAKHIEKDILITNQILNILLSSKINGNIGTLINTIKYTCAHAYINNEKKSKQIAIRLSDVPQTILLDHTLIKKDYNFNAMHICHKTDADFNSINFIEKDENIDNAFSKIINSITNYESNHLNYTELIKSITLSINSISDELMFKKELYDTNSIYSSIVKLNVENALKVMENNYGLKYCENISNILCHSLNYFYENSYKISKENIIVYNEIYFSLKKIFPKPYIITDKFLDIIETNIDYNFNIKVRIYITVYIASLINNNSSQINSIIIAHGPSTASSIASVANKLLGEFVFQSFDMPIEIPIEKVIQNLIEYLQNINTKNGIIILVDMGSLIEIYKPLLKVISGDIGIVSNITTQVAFDVGNRIILGQPIEEILQETTKRNKINYKYIKSLHLKKSAILTICISGIGTAVKIKNLLKQCINDDNIEIIAYDYNKIKNNGIEDKIFNNYNIMLIIGTINPFIKEIPYINLEDLISGKCKSILNSVLADTIKNKNLEEINKDIVKAFSLQNVLDQLIILNPNKLIDQVEEIISRLEMGLLVKFNNDLIISLYIHICVLIERLIMKDYAVSYSNDENFVKCHKDFIEILKKSFSVILKKYKIQIPISEIQIIYQIIHDKVDNFTY